MSIRCSLQQSKLQISDIAKKLNVHRAYISHCFKEVYGVSPKYYALQVRIKKAKELLQRSDLPVSSIAAQLSFSSTGYFCRFFRNHVGFSPHQYRTYARTISL
ncbi:helix-turn-helix transcriptional regulator [Paenibacillus alkalitolerans]|uniref:helix-turn-helix transcriptional regulator n=1 Tax=Paenibacillus alkalitolerans TaxID=2799335 RepID=UPI0018F6F150|nr:helix-turn-helix transcriptional regulator [Paenibacillus alkalitolerans]